MIAVDHVTKTCGTFTGVDDFTFTAHPGRINTGFLGPIGAGKSTTLRVVVGFTPPDHGTAHVLGRFRNLLKPGTEVGVLLDASAQHAGRTGREVLTIAQRAMGPPALPWQLQVRRRTRGSPIPRGCGRGQTF